MMKDLTVLLKQAGASPSSVRYPSAASRLLTEMSEGTSSGLGPIVFLCDDSPTDESNRNFGCPSQTGGEAVGRKQLGTSVHCVAFNWLLFDSMKTSAYEPAAPRARVLWKLTTTNRDEIITGK